MYVSHLLLDQDVNIAVQTFICVVSNECLGQIHNVKVIFLLEGPCHYGSSNKRS